MKGKGGLNDRGVLIPDKGLRRLNYLGKAAQNWNDY